MLKVGLPHNRQNTAFGRMTGAQAVEILEDVARRAGFLTSASPSHGMPAITSHGKAVIPDVPKSIRDIIDSPKGIVPNLSQLITEIAPFFKGKNPLEEARAFLGRMTACIIRSPEEKPAVQRSLEDMLAEVEAKAKAST
jgi:hypothetical protein